MDIKQKLRQLIREEVRRQTRTRGLMEAGKPNNEEYSSSRRQIMYADTAWKQLEEHLKIMKAYLKQVESDAAGTEPFPPDIIDSYWSAYRRYQEWLYTVLEQPINSMYMRDGEWSR
jgi:hypothetical protein